MTKNDTTQLGNERGQWGEQIALALLVSKGYAILEKQWRMGHYEIDIVAQKGDQIVFVEVKVRKFKSSDPVSAVDKRKRARMVSSADVYLQRCNVPFEYRFDIVAITGEAEGYEVEHIEDAFVPPLRKYSYKFKL